MHVKRWINVQLHVVPYWHHFCKCKALTHTTFLLVSKDGILAFFSALLTPPWRQQITDWNCLIDASQDWKFNALLGITDTRIVGNHSQCWLPQLLTVLFHQLLLPGGRNVSPLVFADIVETSTASHHRLLPLCCYVEVQEQYLAASTDIREGESSVQFSITLHCLIPPLCGWVLVNLIFLLVPTDTRVVEKQSPK